MSTAKLLFWGSLVPLLVGAYCGYTLGMLNMKWAARDDLNEARREARVCCESAYVLNKFIAGQLQCSPDSPPEPPPAGEKP